MNPMSRAVSIVTPNMSDCLVALITADVFVILVCWAVPSSEQEDERLHSIQAYKPTHHMVLVHKLIINFSKRKDN